ncbi:J domain-containing protein [Candidatus Poribacteria bacterium]|nr:J domain-containing protein [Candidatus Poribacteria bacterium]
MSDAGTVPAPTTEDLQTARIRDYQQKIVDCRDEIVALTLDCERIRTETRVFQHEYNARIGNLYLELDKIQLTIKELLYRARLVEKGVAHSEEQLDRRVESAFRVERKRVEQGPKRGTSDGVEPKPSSSSRKTPQQRARQLYLRLAKQYHPDKASDAGSRARHADLMALINDAYESEDVATLERLEMTLPTGDTPPTESFNERERRLYREYLRLHKTVGDLRHDRDELAASDTYKMKMDVERGRESGNDPLEELRRGISEKVEAARARLATIREQFTTLTRHMRG